MSKIEIYVCHSPNSNNIYLKSNFYKNIVAGSCFDKVERNEWFLKDCIGDNISNKNGTFNELTVQYWAWKNSDAEYFGFCHYRRFLSFSNSTGNKNERNQFVEDKLTDEIIEKYLLSNEKNLEILLQKYDCITSVRFPTKNILTPKGFKTKNKDHYLADINFFDSDVLDIVREIIKNKYPQYLDSYDTYLEADFLICHNCFIMKKEYFKEFSEFQFGVLFDFESKLNMKNYSACKIRSCGYMSEILNAVYILDLIKRGKKVLEKPIVFINKTEKVDSLPLSFNGNCETLVFSSNDSYIPYFAVTLTSFIKNSNKNKNYEIIVLHSGISNESKKNIYSFVNEYKNFKLIFFDVTYYFNVKNLFINYVGVYSYEVYYRLFSPYILKNRKKALLVDSDLIFNPGFDSIFDFDISNCCVGCVKDLVYQGMLNVGEKKYEKTQKELELEDPYSYVNAGVIYANFENIRKHISFKELYSLCCKHFEIQDQDVLNKVFNHKGLIKYLPYSYNYFNYSNDWVKENIRNSVYSEFNLYNNCFSDIYIIHYANKPKPWENFYIDFANMWWIYCRQSPYFEILYSRFLSSPAPQILTKKQKLKLKFNKRFPLGTRRRRFVQIFIPKRGSFLRNKLSKFLN